MKEIYKNSDEIRGFYNFRDDHKTRFMLRFDFACGRRKSSPYRLITDLHLSEDTNLTIAFVHMTIKITGQNLELLFQAINSKNAGRIVEQHTSPDNLPVGEVFIEKIEIIVN